MRSSRPYASPAPILLSALLLLLPVLSPAAPDVPLLAWEVSVEGHPELGGGSYDTMNDLVPLPDGGVVAAGYTIPEGAYGPDGPREEGLVVRLDAAGRELWRAYLGDGKNHFEARRVRRAPDGGFVVACTAFTPWTDAGEGLYYYTSFVAKLDGNGAETWRHTFDPSRLELLGDFDLFPDGSVVAAGRVWFDQGSTAVAVARLSAAGSPLWVRRTAPEYTEGVARVAALPDGGFYVCSGAAPWLYLGRHAPDGALSWISEIQGLDGSLYAYDKMVHGLQALPSGGAFVVGAARENLYPVYGAFRPFSVAFDGAGRQLSTLVVPTSSVWNHAVERLSDGSLLSAEGAASSNGGVDLARYDGAGRELWRVPLGTHGADTYATALRGTADGGILAAGSVPETAEDWLPFDGYVARYDGGGVVETPPPPPPPAAAPRIDVLPGNPGNPVNPRSKGLLPVALLSSARFDATKVDPASVTLEGAPVAKAGRKHHAVAKDVDGDGRRDLLLHFSVPALKLGASSTRVTMRGAVPGGGTFEASDAVRIVGVPAAKGAPPARKGTGVLRNGGGT